MPSDLEARFRALSRQAPVESERLVNDDPSSVTEVIERAGFYRDQIAQTIIMPARNPHFLEPETPISATTRRVIDALGSQLYAHQARVYDHVQRGTNVVLATPTASGKTLAFVLPTLERLLQDPQATALFLYPTKALAYDQLERLRELDQQLDGSLRPAVYDGDTPAAERAKIRSNARIIISNPHGLHLYLGWHASWESFLANLSVIVIDEAHHYVGSLGASFQGLLWRLQRLTTHYGAHPILIAASGTIANPREHLQSLTGLPFVVVDQSGASQSARTILFWDCTRDPKTPPSTQAAYLTRHLVRMRRSVVVFSNTRAQAEYVAMAGSDRSHRILPYRSGYSPEMRRRVEHDLRSGGIRGVSATSALELGVDIGTLDTVVLNGYPGSISSLWQRLGRAGRTNLDALGIVMVGGDPISRSLLANADELLERSPEHAISASDDTDILTRHLLLAAAELPLSEDTMSDAPGARAALADLLGRELLIQEGSTYRSTRQRPHLSTPFMEREASYEIHFQGTREHRAVEHISIRQALREAHKGAVFLHFGTPFRVQRIDAERREIFCVPETDGHHTQPTLFRSLSQGRTLERVEPHPMLTMERIEALVLEQVTGYKEFDHQSRQVAKRKVTSPVISSPAEAVVISCNDPLYLGIEPEELFAALHALEHALTKVLPLLTNGGASDLASLTLRNGEEPSMVIYYLTKSHPSTVITKVMEHLDEGLHLAERMITGCSCATGCAFCILDPRCDDEVVDKDAALKLAQALQKLLYHREPMDDDGPHAD
ncbi:DEAD/DEAH box helicase [Ferrimicrobium sp.]|uniref:DEAD/DEAH box helicase n=1 Tax=Ferrimicrobium sp. TaxID=2926050 RepID=UPI00262E1AB3|nr:DEAD/DEAH box helicase [Ferrimicrobium sp.]